jgi:hypothetical protein
MRGVRVAVQADDQFGSLNVQEILTVLSEEGFVHFVDGQWQWTQESYPADAVSLRFGDVRQLVVVIDQPTASA